MATDTTMHDAAAAAITEEPDPNHDNNLKNNNPATSRSPSPTPSPPLPTAPGPRASALQKLFGDAVTHILKTCSYANFAACFPTPAAHVPAALRQLHDHFTTRLGDGMRREFDQLVAERRLIPVLNELDRLVEEAKSQRQRQRQRQGQGQHGSHDAADAGKEVTEPPPPPPPIPPHTLPAPQLFFAHLKTPLATWQAQMSARHAELARENERLMETVARQREDIARLMRGVEDVVADLQGSARALAQPEHDLDAVRERTREVDEAMR